MSYNGSGTFVRLTSWQADAQAGVKIKSDRHDMADDDVANALSQVITKDGQTQPTADLPMNGHTFTNLREPTLPTDAATKKYVDAIKAFSTGLEISGADANGQLKFSSTTGANGLTFVGADLSWLARLADAGATPPTKNRLVLNDKPDGSGTDVVVINDDGSITARSTTLFSAIIKALTGNDVLYFRGPADQDRMVIYTGSDTETDGYVRLKGSVTYTFGLNGAFKAPAQVFAANAYLNTDGNIGGGPSSVWSNWGAADAYSAINARIEARAQAWANDRVAAQSYRMVFGGDISYGGVTGAIIEPPSGCVITGMQYKSGYWGPFIRYRYLQNYDPVRGWVGWYNA